MTLVEFLAARLDEDAEFLSRYCSAMKHTPLDPARLLAEVEAKRRIIDLHPMGTTFSSVEGYHEGPPYCRLCSDSDDGPERFPCPTIRALALPYADHPDYDEAWRP